MISCKQKVRKKKGFTYFFCSKSTWSFCCQPRAELQFCKKNCVLFTNKKYVLFVQYLCGFESNYVRSVRNFSQLILFCTLREVIIYTYREFVWFQKFHFKKSPEKKSTLRTQSTSNPLCERAKSTYFLYSKST